MLYYDVLEPGVYNLQAPVISRYRGALGAVSSPLRAAVTTVPLQPPWFWD